MIRRIPAVLLALLAVLPPIAAHAADGAALFVQNCSMCHQADAGGVPGQYPPLKNRVGLIAATPEGRHYLSDLLTNGMAGPIKAAGASYIGYMPSFRQLQDADLAAILAHVETLGPTTPPPITPADIAAARARANTPATVRAERQTLDAQHALP